jgi:hypothetical protein
VTDSAGNAIQGAIVSLKIANLKDTTDSLGKFKLINLPSGNLNTPQTILFNQPILKSGTVYLSVNQTSKVIIDIFTMKGQRTGLSITQSVTLRFST